MTGDKNQTAVQRFVG